MATDPLVANIISRKISKLNLVDGRTGSEQTKQERGWYDAGYTYY